MNNKAVIVELPNGAARAVKNYNEFGGPNMWDVQIKGIDGYWHGVQWMGRGNVQYIFGPLPEFKLRRGKVVPLLKSGSSG